MDPQDVTGLLDVNHQGVTTQDINSLDNNRQTIMPPPSISSSDPPAPESSFPFLKLPAEIRNMIYHFLLANRIVKLGICYYREYLYFAQRSNRLRTDALKNNPHPDVNHQAYGTREYAPLSIALLATCSQIYDEAHLIPYSLNTFSIRCELLPVWLDRRMQFQVQAIRKLTLKVYLCTKHETRVFREQMGEAVDMLTEVKELDLEIVMNSLVAHVGASALWVQGVEMWMGRGLEVARLRVEPVSRHAVAGMRRCDMEGLVEGLIGRLLVG